MRHRVRPWRSATPRAALLLAGLAAVLGSGPVSAAMTEPQQHYENHFTFGYDDCGFHVDVQATSAGSFHFRTGTGADAGVFFVHNRFDNVEVHTRATDGATIVITARAVYQEIKATNVGGSIFEFTQITSGQPFTVRDADGHLLLRESGSIRETILFDSLGDDQPGGVVIESIDFKVSGPHPGLTVDFCALFD